MNLNIVLVSPQIPQNTGNLGRLCTATNTNLHLIKPLGFDLSERAVRRAGLDYWKKLDVSIYENFEEFETKNKNGNFYFLSSKVEKVYWDISFKDGDFLIFGSETKGISPDITNRYLDKCLTIPQFNDELRCLNLANSASIVLYEAIRQIKIN